MKKIKGLLAVVAVMGCGAFNVNAQDVSLKQVEYFAGNSTVFSQKCIEAVNYGMPFKKLRHKFPEYRLKQMVTCNGKSLETFVNEQYEYRKSFKPSDEVVKPEVVAADKTLASELCEAAAKSNKAFKAVLDSRSLPFKRVSHLACNEVPVSDFAKSNGNPAFNF
ncbi:hypothetical protein [Pseudoalteromonas marina]|uniref:DUF3718 domain-containing protein n=1 Tax=Pseudoalteromonas marina TaxID=267375 RepID=A0ABT9FCG0_9GAMM|nr:hypothetical protein [Pseudoalteromonas marina]MDP2564475.1 hypothetical protein [Pseudoalteromonas marina]